MMPYKIEDPDITEPVTVLFDPSGQDSYAFFVDHVERMAFPRTWFFIVSRDELPFFELYVQILPCLPKNIDKG